MTEQPANDHFHASSFMEGDNAEYLEQMYARYASDPSSVDEAWHVFFKALGDERKEVEAEAAGPSWARRDWPPAPAGDVMGALTGIWPEPAEGDAAGKKIQAKAAEKGVSLSDDQVKQAVLDSIRALMIIRAYRIRGHLAADLDPLGMRDGGNHPELDPKSYGFTDADMDRPIFIDNVLGLEIATMKQIVDIVKATYCGTFALQYMHISNPEEAGWLKERIEGYGKEIAFTKNGRRKPCARDGADHQTRRPVGRQRHRHRHAPPGASVRPRQRHAETLQGDLQRISGRQLQTRRRRWLR